MGSRRMVLVVAAITGLVAAACGSGDGDDGAASPAPTVTVTVTETATATAAPSETATPEPTATATATPVDVCADPGLTNQAFIFVTAPTPGMTLASGDTVEGCANVFEAAYQWEILDNASTVLDSGFGTASCGTGCVGTWSFSPSFSVSQVTVGTVRVWADSAKDGSPEHVNLIPVLLQP